VQKALLGMHMKKYIMNNSFWQHTLLYGIGFISLRAISFLLLPFYTTALNTYVAGEVFIFFTFLAFMNAFYSFGMDSSLLKFHSKHNNVFSTSIISILLFSIPLSIILFCLNDVLALFLFNRHTWYINHYNWIIFILIILFFDVLSSRAMTLIRKIEKPFYYLIISLINVTCSLLLTWYFVNNISNQDLRLNGIIIATASVSIIQFIGLLPIIISNIKKPLFNTKIFKEMLSFAWPFFPATIFFIIIELSDRIILEHLCGLNQVGLYGAGYKIAALILMLVRAFNLNWQPYYIKQGKKHGDNEKLIKNKFSKIGSLFLVFLITVITLLSSFYPYIINYIIGENFIESGEIIPIIAMSYGFYGLFILQMPSLFIKNKQNWSPIIWGSGAIINIIGNFLLIGYFNLGYLGAAWATLAAYCAMAFCMLLLNHYWFKIKYNNILILACIILSILLFIISKNFPINSMHHIISGVLYFGTITFISVKIKSQ